MIGLRQRGRPHQAGPRHRVEARIGLGDCRQVGKLLGARFARHRDQADAGVGHLRVRLGHRDEHRGDMSGDHVGQRLRRAAIADVVHFQAGALEKKLHDEVAGAGRTAAAAIGQRGRLRLGVGDELRQVLGRHLGVDQQHLRPGAHRADWDEILDRVVADLGGGCRHDFDHRCARPEQRVAVRRGARDLLGGDDAVTADAGLDDHLLADRLTEARRCHGGPGCQCCRRPRMAPAA